MEICASKFNADAVVHLRHPQQTRSSHSLGAGRSMQIFAQWRRGNVYSLDLRMLCSSEDQA